MSSQIGGHGVRNSPLNTATFEVESFCHAKKKLQFAREGDCAGENGDETEEGEGEEKEQQQQEEEKLRQAESSDT